MYRETNLHRPFTSVDNQTRKIKGTLFFFKEIPFSVLKMNNFGGDST